ncbi:MAG TPA: glycosyltransferase family 39 protein, partial [Candidatus Goldiibacteriota bacterium]|nr:glycosyltransferase family 39 protein [Candidatus Goldiibacteriota bacterium]
MGLLLNIVYKGTASVPDKTKKTDFFICAVLFIFAFVFRYYRLNQIPPGIPYDTEGLSLIMTSRIFHNIMPPFYLNEGVYKITSVYNYLQSLWINLTGNIELQSIRLFSVILGSLTVAVFYFFIKELFNRKVAVIASILLILYLPHIIISRLAWLWVLGPFFCVIAFYLLFLGIRKNNPAIIGLSGVFTGFGLYFYSSSYVVPIVIITFILLYNIKNFNNNIKYLILYLIPLLLTSLPILIFMIKDPNAYILQRTSQESIFKLIKNPVEIFSTNILIKRYLDYLIMLITKSSSWGYFNYPDLPLLNNIFSYFFILGLGVILFNWKNYNYFFMLLTLFIGIFPGVFYIHPYDPSPYRVNMIALSVPAIASIGIVTIWEVLKKINIF